ncbi:MAG: MazG nucleotide pyrophosphohydrolase domain-containing protein [Elusimicrobiota bacterium]|nr:MazG nucleotide pyrophosphohydrolase domain-containing protein [Elusimicrobiota bacterium]
MARGLKKLESVVARLLGPRGCPWDRAQTHKTLIPYLREESRELADALKGGRWHEIEDELGDLLFHLYFHSKIAEKAGHFSMNDVAENQAKKLMRRHPHVFGRTRKFKTEKDVRRHWDEIKSVERALRAEEVAARVAKKRKR